MGFYENYLDKAHNQANGKLSLAEEMEMVKMKKEFELDKDIEELRASYQDYASAYSMRSKIVPYRESFGALFAQQRIGFLIEQKEKMEGQSVSEYFRDLFEAEKNAVISYEYAAYKTMSNCVEKEMRLSRNGIISTIYDALGKKDDALQEASNLFNKANSEAYCATEAKNEWENLSNLEKAMVLITRFKLTGTTEFNPEEMDEYAREPHEEDEFTCADFSEEQ